MYSNHPAGNRFQFVSMRSLFFTVFILVMCSVRAQQPGGPVPIQFQTGSFYAGIQVKENFQNTDSLAGSRYRNGFFVVLQFEQIPTTAGFRQLNDAGILLGSYLPGNAYLARIPEPINWSLLNRLGAVAVDRLPAIHKTDPTLWNAQPHYNKEERLLIALQLFPGVSRAEAVAELQLAGISTVSTRYDESGLLFLPFNRQLISRLQLFPFISYIALQDIGDKPLNQATRGAHGVSVLQSPYGRNLQGNGVFVGIGDNADISTHTDFTGRLINRSPWIPADHGTHVAGTTGGAGILMPRNKGMAPRATLINQLFSDILINAPVYYQDFGMILSNNSYYSVSPGCAGEGRYDILSNYIDKQMQQYREILHVVAAGNDGSFSCSPYPTSYGTVKSGWQTAKNVLTVGAINAQDYSIASFSSRGPVNDGRIKPEITANGWAVLSTISNNNYGYNYGTSMATPVVTGTMALLYERYRQKNLGLNPAAATIKAIACNTAEDLGNTGPDYTFGFGMLQASRAADAIDQGRYLTSTASQGSSNTHTIAVPAGTRRLKVLIHWSDPEAAANAASTLVNDLDLVVTTSGGQQVLPLILNAAAGSVTAPATNGTDHTNNIEQVVIENPAAGNYTATVTGYQVPAGPQAYTITWDIVETGVTVEYPFGGETLVPGETEYIRWRGYGNESASYTVDYSDNNGSSWNTISSNADAASRSLSWVVPSVTTTQAKVRVTRNGGGASGTSTYNFTILPVPAVTAQSVCEGAVQLSWNTISGATGYTIYQLSSDTMKVIGTSTSLTYLVTGLNKNKSYHFSVAAGIAGVPGRRSIAVKITPSSGSCSLPEFSGDVRIDSILEPNTARQFYADAALASKPVKIRIKNTGSTAVSGSFNVSYSYAGNTITETISPSIAAGSSYTHTFSTLYTIPAEGYRYDFKAWVTRSSDPNHGNDTAYKTVRLINNAAITSLPLTEGFESMGAVTVTEATRAVSDNKYLDFSASSSRGRLRTFVNSGIARNGTGALTLDQAPSNDVSTVDSAKFHFNLSNYTSQQLRFDFDYFNHGQPFNAGNKIWLRGNETAPWVEAYDLYSNQAALGDWKHGIININEILAAAVPAQQVSSTFQVLIGQEGYTSANSPKPVVDADDGYTFDNLKLSEAIHDVGLSKINFPQSGGCALTATTPIGIRIRNYDNITVNNVTVGYRINGGTAFTETISIAANATIDHVFSQTADFSTYTDYSLDVWASYNPDNYRSNDTIANYSIHNSPVVTIYPYHEGFETNNGYYYTKGTNSSWEWGNPVKPLINRAANGTKVWATNLTGNYTDNETSYLISPCFDVSALSHPVLSFSHAYSVELDYDYTWVEYSTDGVSWQKLGSSGNGTNWYDNASANNWRVSNSKWHVASFELPQNLGTVRFRFVMSSDGGVTDEGVAIDDIRVFERDRMAIYPLVNEPVTENVSGSNWIKFIYMDPLNENTYILAEVNAQGQQLGSTEIMYYPNQSGLVRNTATDYYLDRNFRIRFQNKPVSPVTVRLYFTDAEVNAVLAATSCGTCSKPTDAYALGITHYKGSATDENDNLEDDVFGRFTLIAASATDILPHNNGYFAEFQVTESGEYWFGKNLLQPTFTGKCPADAISYSVSGGLGTTFQWQVDTGSGYTNLAESAIYSGTTSSTITITGAPGTYSGNRYRCMVDGIARDEHILRFYYYWNGSMDNNWFQAANWSCNEIPGETADVIIPAGLSRYPSVNSNVRIRSLKILTNVPLQLASGIKIELLGR